MKFCPLCRKRHDQETLEGQDKGRPINFIRCTGCGGIHSMRYLDAVPDARGVERQRVSEELWRWLEINWPFIQAHYEIPLRLHETQGVLGRSGVKGKPAPSARYTSTFFRRLSPPAGVAEVCALLDRLEVEQPDAAYFIVMRAMGLTIRTIAASDVLTIHMVRAKNGELTRTGQKLVRTVMGLLLECMPDEIVTWWKADGVRAECRRELEQARLARERYLSETVQQPCPRCAGADPSCDLCREGRVPLWLYEVYQEHGENWRAEVSNRQARRQAQKKKQVPPEEPAA